MFDTRCTVPAKSTTVNNSLTVIIASAGIGKRMKSKGTKSLLTINGGTTILEQQIKNIWKVYPKADIIVVIGFQAYKLRSAFRGVQPIRFVYNPSYEINNVMYSVSLGIDCSISSNLLVMHGDIVFNTQTIADMCGPTSKILVLPESHQSVEQEIGVIVQGNMVTNLAYGLPRVWGQMVYVTGKESRHFEKIAFNHEISSNWFLFEGINNVISSGGAFVAHSPNTMKFIEINSLEDLARAKIMTL